MQRYLSKCKNCPKVNVKIAKKCCFCIPLRKGVIIFGYVNIVLSLLSLPLLVYLLVEEITTDKPLEVDLVMIHPHERINGMIYIPMTIAFVVVDVIMTIVLLVGAHKKKLILLKIYFYFGIVFQLLTLCTDLIYFDFREYIENTIYFLFLGLNIYLLYLVFCLTRTVKHSSEVQYVSYQDDQRAAF